jgi:hypothetical protein
MSKESFAKLTENLENLAKSESSEEPSNVVEPETVVAEPENKDQEPEKVEDKTEEVKAEGEEKEVVEPQADPELVSKADKEDKPKKKDDKKDDGKDEDEDEDGDDDEEDEKNPQDKDAKKDKKVKKSEEVKEESISEKDFLGAFEAVLKSFGSIKGDHESLTKSVARIEKGLEDVLNFVKEKFEPVTKSEETTELEQTEEPVAKSEEVTSEEAPEGKAVEFVSKSTEEGASIPQPEVNETEVPEEKVEEFRAKDHVNEFMDYFMKNANNMEVGEKAVFRQALHRVNRGNENTNDINLFKEVTNYNENSEN